MLYYIERVRVRDETNKTHSYDMNAHRYTYVTTIILWYNTCHVHSIAEISNNVP